MCGRRWIGHDSPERPLNNNIQRRNCAATWTLLEAVEIVWECARSATAKCTARKAVCVTAVTEDESNSLPSNRPNAPSESSRALVDPATEQRLIRKGRFPYQCPFDACRALYRHIRSRLAATSVVAPDFLAGRFDPCTRSRQPRHSKRSVTASGINRLRQA
jgi:hypothetical protein